MNTKIFETLPPEAIKIRETVFVKEQGFQNEIDKVDDIAKHIVLFDNEMPIATCRFFIKNTNENYVIGRIAVMGEYRGKNIGSYLIETAESAIRKLGGKCIYLHSQTRATSFYKKLGYNEYGNIDFDENCPHIWMCKQL